MKLFNFLKPKSKPMAAPTWSRQLRGETLYYHGEEITLFLKEFDRIEDEVINLWGTNKLSWDGYQQGIFEIQEARRLFVRFAYN